ncbi:MAG: hypothetical protein H6924_07525 [Alphaproteobacteria bacterium]|nr:hypothetical protein [Alphaproteobacteria bacterium]
MSDLIGFEGAVLLEASDGRSIKLNSNIEKPPPESYKPTVSGSDMVHAGLIGLDLAKQSLSFIQESATGQRICLVVQNAWGVRVL